MLPFVDTHFHLWDRRSGLPYEMLENDEPHSIIGDLDGVRMQRFGPAEFEAQSRFQNVTKAIHVTVSSETEDLARETEWVTGVHERVGFPAAIVAKADLSADSVEQQLDRQAAFPLVRGLRGANGVEEIQTAAWRRGYADSVRHNFVFCHHFGVGEGEIARDLAREFPGAQLCIDQAGIPRQRDPEYRLAWTAAMKAAALADNTVCKISSLGMTDQRWTVDSLRPFVLGCIEAFGTERCFFGSNWPMDSLASTYSDLLNAYREIVSEFTESEQAALLAGNAERIWRI